MKQNWFQEAKLRFTLSTPWFFKVLIRVGLACTSAGGGLLALAAIPHIKLGLWVPGLGSNLLVAGVVMAAVSKAVTTTPQDLPNNKPNPIPKHEDIDNVNLN